MAKLIERTGTIHFGDASLHIWEDGHARNATFNEQQEWDRRFKRQVFARTVQTMNRLGWTVGPWDQAAQYKAIAHRHRTCHKGDLRAELAQSGRHIELKMWQGVNTPTRPDHGGKYEPDKEGCMPFLIWLEMERTRRHIRGYLCNVLSGYTFDAEPRTIYRAALEKTALQRIQQHYAESSHFKGDWPAYVARCMESNRKSADGALLEHGQRVWYFDRKGRCCVGIAMYNINNMWWVLTGKYHYTNEASFRLYARQPENLRVKRNADLRRKRLEQLMAEATVTMNFERALVLRDLLFRKGEQVFVVLNTENNVYHRPGFNGYAGDVVAAGKFTADEVAGWNTPPNRVIELGAVHG